MKTFLQLTIVLFFVSNAFAEGAAIALGADPLTNQDYHCIVNQKPKKNRVRITSQNGNTKIVSRAKARRNAQRSMRQAKRLLKRSNKSLKKARRQRARLNIKLNQTEKTIKKIEKLDARIPKLEDRVDDLKNTVAILRETLSGIRRCAKEEDVRGSFTPISGTAVDSLGRTVFHTGYYYVIDDWDVKNTFLCVRVNGSSPRQITVFAPRNCLFKDPVRDADRCFIQASTAFNNRYYVPVTGTTGIQRPGTCANEPWLCSLAEAQARASSTIADTTYQLVGAIPRGGRCPQ